MLGNLISTVIKVATLPVDAANAGLDMLCGGDGSKKSRTQADTPLTLLENLRDEIAKAVKDADQ